MPFVTKSLLLLLILVVPAAAYCSLQDTIKLKKGDSDSTEVSYFTEANFLCSSRYSHIDSSLKGFQRYWLKNSLGNPGSAISPLILSQENTLTGFRYWKNPFSYYMFSKESMRYYHTQSPYTNLYFTSGSKEEQIFNGVHSQSVTDRLNFGLGFQRLRSGGDYVRQSNTHTSAFINSNYSSKKGRYFLLANVVYNNLKAEENGGIEDDEEFAAAGFGDKKLIGVRLEAAQRRIWNKGFYAKQFFAYGNIPADSTVKDTARIIPNGFFTHSLSAEDNSIVYRDDNPTSGYYPNIFRDSVETRDSVYYYKIENEVAWNITGAKKTICRPLFHVGVRHQLVKLRQYEIDTVINNMLGNAELAGESGRVDWKVNADYCFAGASMGDMNANGVVNYKLKDSTSYFSLDGNFSNKTPEFLYNRFISNHNEWSCNWAKSQIASAEVSFVSRHYRFSAGIGLIQFNNPLYFDTDLLPKQYGGSINSMIARVEKDFHLGRWVFANRLTYQMIPDSTIIRLPELVSENSIYYERSFIKPITIQIGIDVLYTTGFMGNAYMPVTSQFYLQNEKEIGNYPYADVFVNMRVRTVKFFVKYEHANAGFMGNRYYLVANHPMADQSFAFGLSWDFYN
jgi:hypothetical protein